MKPCLRPIWQDRACGDAPPRSVGTQNNEEVCKTSTTGSNPALASSFFKTKLGGDKRYWPTAAKFDHNS
jgi:hypothetical protein